MMLKKDITYKNIDGVEVQRTWYFNLSKAELAEMALRFGGAESLQAMLKRMIEVNNGDAIIQNFKMILLASVGKRVGDNLVKDQDTQNDFLYSGAYDAVFMELLTDTEKCVEFIKAIVPGDLGSQSIEQAAKEMKIDLPPQDVPQLAPDKLMEIAGDSERSMRSKINEATRRRLQDMSLDEIGRLTAQEFEDLKKES